jgi:hypothetical protein
MLIFIKICFNNMQFKMYLTKFYLQLEHNRFYEIMNVIEPIFLKHNRF